MKENMIIISTYFVTLPIFECSFHVEYLSGNLTLNQQLPLVTPCAEPIRSVDTDMERNWTHVQRHFMALSLPSVWRLLMLAFRRS